MNSRQARHFAEATGKLARTDRTDAAIPAHMGAVLELETRAMPSPIMNELRELHVAREALMKTRTVTKNRAKILTLVFLKKQNRDCLSQIERHMKAIENEIMALIANDPDLSWRFDIIVSNKLERNCFAEAIPLQSSDRYAGTGKP